MFQRGPSQRDILRNMAQQSGAIPEALKKKPVPPQGTGYLIDYFWEISASRKFSVSDMGGVLHQPLEQGEIESWARNNRVELNSWHCRVIKALDTAYLDFYNDPDRRKSK